MSSDNPEESTPLAPEAEAPSEPTAEDVVAPDTEAAASTDAGAVGEGDSKEDSPGGEANPPSLGEGEANPPAPGDGEANPTSGDGEANPTSGEGEANPPASGEGEANPEADPHSADVGDPPPEKEEPKALSPDDAPGDGDGAAPPPEEEEDSTAIRAVADDEPVLWNEGRTDYYYDTYELDQKSPVGRLPPDYFELKHSFGMEAHRRNNIKFIEDHVVIFASGNTIQLHDIHTKRIKFINGMDCGGVGAIAVHPERTYFAVGLKGDFPDILIYEYPSLKLYRRLPKGTDRAYSDLCFNASGTKLASVGSSPDYMLTLWNWRKEQVLLRCKAFAQEVYNVKFAPSTDGKLITCGTGHIRFWKMARTFTGLKLQGDLGKFGKVELSDVAANVELPDGKIVSGTEAGNLLIWDGNLIHCEIARPNGRAHEGSIEVVYLDNGFVFTAGTDGYIRKWEAAALDEAYPLGDEPVARVEPVEEICVGGELNDVSVKGLVCGTSGWLVQDERGGMWEVDYHGSNMKQLMTFHGSPVVGLDTAPNSFLAASIGEAGEVCVYNVVDQKTLYMERFPCGGTGIKFFPTSVDTEGKTLAAGFSDGVVRILRICEDGLRLVHALKPHKSNVTAMAVSPDGNIFVTGSTDQTVFLFDLSQEYAPVGFVNVGDEVTSLSWDVSGDQFFVGLSDGEVRQMTPPTEQPDTSKSFEISLQERIVAFEEPEPEPEPKEEAKPEKKEGEGDKEGGGEGDGDGDGDGANDADADAAAAPPPEIDNSPTPVMSLLPKASSRYFVTFGGRLKGKLFECHMAGGAPLSVIKTLSDERKRAATVQSVRFSTKGTFVMLGLDDGTVEIRPVADLNNYWCKLQHDASLGGVTSVCTTFDEQYVVTAGRDGMVFVRRVAVPPKVMIKWDKMAKEKDMDEMLYESQLSRERRVAEEKGRLMVDSMWKKDQDPAPATDDITDEEFYSIQEAKLKAEHDHQVALAEAKKAKVREKICDLQAEFEKVKEEAKEAPSDAQLPPEDFEIDPELTQMLKEAGVKKAERVTEELAWVSEKKTKALEKLRAKFLDVLAVEDIKLKSFKSNLEVSSFRTLNLRPELKEDMKAVHALIAREEANRKQTDAKDGDGDGADGGGRPGDNPDDKDEKDDEFAEDSDKGSGDEDDGDGHVVSATVSKAEAKKRKREKRAKEWEELISAKPDDKYEDPQDVAAIAWAEKNMGDFKLKTDPNYVVPESQRVNAEKKRRQMVLLEESVHAIRMGYNSRFLALRDLKNRIIRNIERDNLRVAEINELLGVDEPLWVPKMAPDETPENREEISKEELVEYERLVQQREEDTKKAAAGSGGGFGGFPGGGGGGAKPPAESAQTKPPPPKEVWVDDGDSEGGRQRTTSAVEETSGPQLSELERIQKDFRDTLLRYEKKKLLEKIDKTVKTFDNAHLELYRERFKLEADLKMTDMRVILLYKELTLLKEFEKRDNSLAQKLEAKRAEKAEIVSKIAECQERLSQKKVEIERLLEIDKQIMTEFNQMVGEGNKFYDALLKIFKRKIKRVKKKQNDNLDMNEDDDFDDEDDSDYDSDDDFDEQEEEDTCPPGCDQALFERVCELREKRLDQEDVLAEFQRSVEALRKENDAQVKKEKIIDQALQAIEQDIQAFQTEKQRKLNELDVVITLRLSQIDHKEGGRLPKDLSQCLVINRSSLIGLESRVRTLQQEKSNLRKKQKELRREHVVLGRNKKAHHQKISALEARCHEVQMLKFGQEVDLEALEKMSVNKTAEELKQRLGRLEAKQEEELRKWDEKIAEAMTNLSHSTRANTDRLQRVADLSQRQHTLEQELNNIQAPAERKPSKLVDPEERRRLIQLVKLQARELDALKAEITLLRRKGGHVYTPVPPIPGPPMMGQDGMMEHMPEGMVSGMEEGGEHAQPHSMHPPEGAPGEAPISMDGPHEGDM